MSGRLYQHGLTLVEVLVAVTLIAVMLVPAMQALQTSAVGAEIHRNLAVDSSRLKSRLEEVLSEPFTNLADAATASTVPSAYSDAGGSPGRLLVFVAFYDGDNADGDGNPFTGTDDDIVWIRVQVEGTVHNLTTLRAQGI